MNDSRIGRIVEIALLEDGVLGDLTSDAAVPDALQGEGEILCKEAGIIAGLEVATLVFRFCDPGIDVRPAMRDGERVGVGQRVAVIAGGVKGILHGERTALNFMQRMSGIATLTAKFVAAVQGTRCAITDTRKTAPGMRVLDKWAVRLGGGVNHRFGLDDMVLIKDNHIVAAGGIAKAVALCTDYLRVRGINANIEVETRNLEEVREALSCAGISRIMLDNFQIPEMQRAVGLIGGRVEVEASGGITLETVRSYAETGVDLISLGVLTHSVKALDISLKLSHHV